MTHSGFSLIELLVVIAIIVISSSLVAFGVKDYQEKSKVERQVRQIATDIGEIRIRALTMKQRHNLVLNQTGYVFQSYSSDDQPKCSGTSPGGTNLPGKSINTTYQLKKNATTYYAGSCANVGGDTYEIDQRGMLSGTTATIFIDYPGTTAALDCLTLHTIRVNVGKKNGANCDDK